MRHTAQKARDLGSAHGFVISLMRQRGAQQAAGPAGGTRKPPMPWTRVVIAEVGLDGLGALDRQLPQDERRV